MAALPVPIDRIVRVTGDNIDGPFQAYVLGSNETRVVKTDANKNVEQLRNIVDPAVVDDVTSKGDAVLANTFGGKRKNSKSRKQKNQSGGKRRRRRSTKKHTK
jgi:hypothetical protein